MKLIILLAVIIGIFDIGNGYSKYGRTCKDIGCTHNEECVMKEDACSRSARQSNCGTYPACQRVSSQPQTCSTFVCPPTQECKIQDGVPRCVAQVSSGSGRHRRQAYNPNYSSGGVTTYPHTNYNPGSNYNPNSPSTYPNNLPTYNPNQQPHYNPNQQPNYNPNQQPHYNPNQQPNYNSNQNHLNQPNVNYNNSRPGIYPNLTPVNPLQYPGPHPGQNQGNLPVYNPNTGHNTNTGTIGGHPTYPNTGNTNAGNDFYVSQTQGNRPNTNYPNTGTNQGVHGQTYPIQPGYQGGNYRTNY